MKIIIALIVFLKGFFAFSQSNTAQNSSLNEDLLKGEWLVKSNFSEDELLFELFQPKEKSSEYNVRNTIQFDLNSEFLQQKVYGVFGCGTAAMANLRLREVKWSMVGNYLKFEGRFRDFNGYQNINSLYEVVRKENLLLLKRVK